MIKGLTPPLSMEQHFALVIPPLDAMMLGVLLTAMAPNDVADADVDNIAMLNQLGADLLENLKLSGTLDRDKIPAEAPDEFEVAVTYATVKVIVDANREVHIVGEHAI